MIIEGWCNYISSTLLPYGLSDIGNFHDTVQLHYPEEVLFEQGVVEHYLDVSRLLSQRKALWKKKGD